MYQRILLAYDGSESGQKALLECHDIAQWSQAQMLLIAVMPNPAAFIAVDGGVYDAGRDEIERKKYNAILEDGLERLKAVRTRSGRANCWSVTRSTRSRRTRARSARI